MSCYICEEVTFNRIATAILDDPYCRTMAAQFLGLDEAADFQYLLISRMLELNVRAFRARYEDAPEIPLTPARRMPASLIQVYKSLRCYLYQTCEGDCEDDPFYRFLSNTVLAYFAGNIIHNLPEYHRSAWE